MKTELKRKIALTLLGFFVGWAISALFLTGCASGPQRVAFNIESGAVVTADTAMGAWGDYVRDFQPGPQVESKVRDAYQKYQKAMVGVIDASQMAVSLAAINSTNAPTAEAARQVAAEKAAAALADLVDLVRSFGVDPSRTFALPPVAIPVLPPFHSSLQH